VYLRTHRTVPCVFEHQKTKTKQFIWWGKTKYIVTISTSDTYDFKLFGKNDAGAIKRAINNLLGYYPQTWGVLKVYKWSISFTMDYYY